MKEIFKPVSEHPWIDISMPIAAGAIHWPGDPEVAITKISDLAAGADYTTSAFSMGAHCGTHMDAPGHCIQEGQSIDRIPITAIVGPARVIEITHPQAILESELGAQDILEGERILFKTRNSLRPWYEEPFDKEFVYISPDAAAFLAARKVQVVGIDYLSVGGFREDNRDTHVNLLQAGIWLIEGIFLGNVAAGAYELVCLPLKLQAEAAPARAVLRSMR